MRFVSFPALAAALAAAAAFPASATIDPSGSDRSIDACTDFYAYANRRWIDATSIPEDRSVWGSFSVTDENNQQVLKAGLDAALAPPAPEGSNKRKVLQYYASGLDAKAIDAAGIAPLKPDLDTIAAIRGASDLAAVFALLQAQGIEAPFEFTVRQDLKDSTRYLPELAQGGLGLPDRDAYFRDDPHSKEVRAAYRAYIARVLELVGGNARQASSEADRIIAFESELARAAMTPVERRDVDKTYNRMTIDDLAREAPGFDWNAYFQAIGLKGTRELNVTQPRFAQFVARFAEAKPAAEWRTYLRWHTLRAAASKLPEPYAQAAFDFQEGVLNGVKKRPERWREVVLIIGGRYGTEPLAHGLGQIFVERAFPPEAKARAIALIGNIKAALGDRLKSLEWMGEETRARALEKLSAMNVKAGYPEKWRDFSAADVGPHPFVENWLRANEFRHRRDLARIGRPVDRDEWILSPHIVNAFYNGRMNEIVIPAGILQPPFFDAKADDAVNYGGIGMVIGHEITHGFDDRGRRFDAKGNLRDWWTKADAERYLDRTGRIVKQYDGFVGVNGIHVNGGLTLGENISDIGGVKIAYLALQKALQAKPQPPIDSLTSDQRFFLSIANIWRSKYREERERLLLRIDGHSPPRFRVNGSLSHMPEFARAFSCKEGAMVRSEGDRAEIW